MSQNKNNSIDNSNVQYDVESIDKQNNLDEFSKTFKENKIREDFDRNEQDIFNKNQKFRNEGKNFINAIKRATGKTKKVAARTLPRRALVTESTAAFISKKADNNHKGVTKELFEGGSVLVSGFIGLAALGVRGVSIPLVAGYGLAKSASFIAYDGVTALGNNLSKLSTWLAYNKNRIIKSSAEKEFLNAAQLNSEKSYSLKNDQLSILKKIPDFAKITKNRFSLNNNENKVNDKNDELITNGLNLEKLFKFTNELNSILNEKNNIENQPKDFLNKQSLNKEKSINQIFNQENNQQIVSNDLLNKGLSFDEVIQIRKIVRDNLVKDAYNRGAEDAKLKKLKEIRELEKRANFLATKNDQYIDSVDHQIAQIEEKKSKKPQDYEPDNNKIIAITSMILLSKLPNLYNKSVQASNDLTNEMEFQEKMGNYDGAQMVAREYRKNWRTKFNESYSAQKIYKNLSYTNQDTKKNTTNIYYKPDGYAKTFINNFYTGLNKLLINFALKRNNNFVIDDSLMLEEYDKSRSDNTNRKIQAIITNNNDITKVIKKLFYPVKKKPLEKFISTFDRNIKGRGPQAKI